MATNYERYSSPEGLKALILSAITYSEDCSLCKRYGFAKLPCHGCIASVKGYDEGEFDRRIDEWLKEESK